MKQETKEDYNNCLNVDLSESDSDESVNVYKSLNEDFLKNYISRLL